MHALITGGAGFIGSHLVEALLQRGMSVTVIDDLSTGRTENLQAVAGHPALETVWGSILEEERLQELVDQADIVYHLAAAVGVRLILDRPVETIETNILGTDRVLRCAAKQGRKLVLASSSEVYGKNPHVPLREDDDALLGPTTKSRWSYACSKTIDEFLSLAYWEGKGLPVVIARYFNTIGPRQTGRYGMVVPRFVQQALAGAPITVYGDGTQSRSFTDVVDTVRATIALSFHEGAVGQVYNVGNDHEVTIYELAQRVKALTASPSPIVFISYEQAFKRGFEDLHRRVPDISKIRQAVGYEPRVDVETSLRGVIDFCRSKQSPSPR